MKWFLNYSQGVKWGLCLLSVSLISACAVVASCCLKIIFVTAARNVVEGGNEMVFKLFAGREMGALFIECFSHIRLRRCCKLLS